MAFPERPVVAERTVYASKFKSETFIVPLLKAAIEKAIETYATTPGGQVLDVGCGGQPFRAILEKKGYRYFGLDVHPTEGVAVDFLCGIDAILPAVMAAGPFDLILCTEVLEHVAEWPTAFENLAGLLKPGGKLVLTAPHFYYLHEEPYDFFRPTTHAFTHFAGRQGLQVVEMQQLGDAWDVLGTLASASRFEALDQSWVSRALAWGLWKARNWVFGKIAAGYIRRRVAFHGPTYLSNFVVMERPERPPPRT